MKPLNLSKPHVIITVGIPGSGKTFFAEHFADTFKAPIISFDGVRSELFTTPTFSDDEDRVVAKVANFILKEVLKTGRTIIYDGLTDLRTNRALIMKISRDAGYEPLMVWVQTETTTAKKRATKRSINKNAISLEQFEASTKRFSPPHPTEKTVVISGKHTYNSQLKIVLRQLIEPRSLVVAQPLNIEQSATSRSNLIR